ncbi:hypothetical protein M0G43_11335 [Subsaxibacter sp. CAU 1640]|uniref:hypothetical protein n=1 Tax=Subsaxibacter sp. CAU 1640 TaxID=2933271 RepID=UPI0020044098|nr:hypothetical protein [Subsaxibacter sp. CAU 1640]MCK7591169.1 hypothetical protein [Subsaxibacter sp. CAU 1640]
MKNIVTFLVGALVGAGIVYFLCCNDDTEEIIGTPKGIITPAEASALDEAFNSRHLLISDSIVKRPDNRSSWYSLQDVRDYLTIAEKQATGLGYKMNGVRIYLGAYPDTANEVGYTTMFFIPTGNEVTAESNMFNFKMTQTGGSSDIPGGKGLNAGIPGDPPSANYPQ